jgi:recombinational DNA repair ATPase RecF
MLITRTTKQKHCYICYQLFRTYNDTTCRPGPLLNVIIGANGTGMTHICFLVIFISRQKFNNVWDLLGPRRFSKSARTF